MTQGYVFTTLLSVKHERKEYIMKNKKDLGVIIQFDDKEYSKEEIEFLWERFIFILAEAQNIDFDPKIIRKLNKDNGLRGI